MTRTLCNGIVHRKKAGNITGIIFSASADASLKFHKASSQIKMYHIEHMLMLQDNRGRIVHTLQSRSLSGRHVSTSFLDPVLGAMMKQVCWHSGRSKAYRGLPEARMAASRLLGMCWSSRGLPRLLLAPFTASSEK